MPIHYAKLSQDGAIAIEGPDTLSFLQGQTSCDFDTLTDEHSIVGACCNPQGRVLFDFRALLTGADSVLLLMPLDIVEVALQVLGKYIVFSKAELRDASGEWQQFGCWSDQPLPIEYSNPAIGAVAREGSSALICEDDAGHRARVLTAAGTDQDVFRQVLNPSEEVEEREWRRQEILAGIPHVTAATSGEFLPQMLNFEHLDRISFTKGCYTGQEVVARMHYKGKVKRPLFLARSTHPAVDPGVPLYATGAAQAAGTVINAINEEGDGCLLLINAATSALEAGLQMTEPGGPVLEILPLPYSTEA